MKTQTLSWDPEIDDPSISIVEGDLTPDQFNKAYLAEGWDHADYGEEELKKDFFVIEDNLWKVVTKDTPNSKLYTYINW